MTESTTPLDGVVVLALEAAVSAPFATRQLADLGATVIKIERRDGGDFARHYDAAIDGSSAFFVWANRAKQSLALDIKEPVDRDTFDRLIGSADVFIQNLSPAAASRLGVTAEQLRELQFSKAPPRILQPVVVIPAHFPVEHPLRALEEVRVPHSDVVQDRIRVRRHHSITGPPVSFCAENPPSRFCVGVPKTVSPPPRISRRSVYYCPCSARLRRPRAVFPRKRVLLSGYYLCSVNGPNGSMCE